MKKDYNSRRDLWGPFMAGQIKLLTDCILNPCLEMRRKGWYAPASLGSMPVQSPVRGQGVHFSAKAPRVHYAKDVQTPHETVSFFEEFADDYESAVAPFSEPVFQEAMREVGPHIGDDFRIADCGCGPGRECLMLAQRVAQGEVVGIDLARNMVRRAYRRSKEMSVDNVAFYQCDISSTPPAFWGAFDIVFCMMSLSYFHDRSAAARGMANLCAPQGMVCVVEAEESLFSKPWALAQQALLNPGFQGYPSSQELLDLLGGEGLGQRYVHELFPGINLFCAWRG